MNTPQPHQPSAMEAAASADPDDTAAEATSPLFLTTRQAAVLLAVTPHHLVTLRAAGRGPAHYRTPTGAAMYFVDDLHDWNLVRPTVIHRSQTRTRRTSHDVIR